MKLKKKVKIPPKKKTKEERIEEVLSMRQKLRDLGINNNITDNFAILTKTMRNFVDTGESQSGKIRLGGTNRTAVYIFSAISGKQSSLNLKFTPTS